MAIADNPLHYSITICRKRKSGADAVEMASLDREMLKREWVGGVGGVGVGVERGWGLEN